MGKNILEMAHIVKEFPGVKALDDVTFKVAEGEIHFLVGENGAGKSTLMKVLSGVHPYGTYEGQVIIDGEVQTYKTIKDSERAGLAIIYQELALISELSVYENIYLGHEIKKKNGSIDWNETIIRAQQQLAKVGLDVDPGTQIKNLGTGKQQLIEIAKALSKNIRILILDEPTSSLNEDDSENLLELILNLKKQGVTCIMISHKLKEVLKIADTVTILRDGRTVATLPRAELSEEIIIKHMVGREIKNIYPKRAHADRGDVVFEVKDWKVYDYNISRQLLKGIDLNVRRGEILGLAGLMGAGRTEFALSVFGNPRKYKVEGTALLFGKPVDFRHSKDAIAHGFAYVSEDRKRDGLILEQDVKQNITIASLKQLVKNNIIDKNREITVSEKYRQELKIKTPSIDAKVNKLSGGNQQKVSLAKWLMVKPDILILDEPTRGIDVGAKYEIYTLMNTLVEQGMSIIMISSELPEILGMSDRIYVVSGGVIAGELSGADATQEKIMHLATAN
ncbi:ATP-binding cassette domain-containing protein [Treponema brennaborense]|uniref:Monosaccharide-transporting ATPase n=1 Tax=Treponema brennaborense (strain DSM 12168 / CIP 105900 / DD5/3) TaxID=906968 RepID=F4LPH0_TREBD|nr:ATP-binding cassette domain-containing protein [Treponema brennaborense]AEE15981.1 Monosaccharide-transporting ATPase [Treponema brennaborense DSM 12168]